MGAVFDTPAGRMLDWYLDMLATAGAHSSAADRELLIPELAAQQPDTDAGMRHAWERLASMVGAYEVESVDGVSEFAIAALLSGKNDRHWTLHIEVEEAAPHRLCSGALERLYDFEVTTREATEADSAALSAIERRCPIVLGGTSVTFDRGDNYFAFARLMEDACVAIGFVDGEPAAINCGGLRSALIGGVERRIMVAVHTRVLPEHQGKGLWGAVSNVLNQKYPHTSIDGSCGFVSVDNAAMQQGFVNTPNKWGTQALRTQLDCAALAGPPAGRPASPPDAPRVVEILNACHASEEMYLPYAIESLTARLERAPRQYSWERVWLTDRAVAGVWPAGESIRVIIEGDGARTDSRRGLVLDYGFLPGAQDELEALLRAWCAWLAKRGMDTLSIFTSERSLEYDRLRTLAREVDVFDMWTPGIEEPAGAPERGLYVDQVYF